MQCIFYSVLSCTVYLYKFVRVELIIVGMNCSTASVQFGPKRPQKYMTAIHVQLVQNALNAVHFL
jgi:hypothetical protein